MVFHFLDSRKTPRLFANAPVGGLRKKHVQSQKKKGRKRPSIRFFTITRDIAFRCLTRQRFSTMSDNEPESKKSISGHERMMRLIEPFAAHTDPVSLKNSAHSTDTAPSTATPHS